MKSVVFTFFFLYNALFINEIVSIPIAKRVTMHGSILRDVNNLRYDNQQFLHGFGNIDQSVQGFIENVRNNAFDFNPQNYNHFGTPFHVHKVGYLPPTPQNNNHNDYYNNHNNNNRHNGYNNRFNGHHTAEYHNRHNNEYYHNRHSNEYHNNGHSNEYHSGHNKFNNRDEILNKNKLVGVEANKHASESNINMQENPTNNTSNLGDEKTHVILKEASVATTQGKENILFIEKNYVDVPHIPENADLIKNVYFLEPQDIRR